MAETQKLLSHYDQNQTLKAAFNDVDSSFSNSGFLTGKVGRKILVGGAAEVETYSFIEDGVVLYVLTLTYTSDTKETLVSAERTA